MNPTTLTAALLLVTGLSVAAWKLHSGGEPTSPAPDVAAGEAGPPATVEGRIAALEAAVAEERKARQLLEDELQYLYAELGTRDAGEPGRGPATTGDEPAESETPPPDSPRSRRNSPERRVEELVAAGFSADRAEWVMRRESELRFEAMQARFDATRAGERPDPFDPALNPEIALRGELGDPDYERYLEASGRPTSVAVRSVLESSAGQSAGLQSGDQITRYDGERVFSTFDLYRQTMQGEAGESVVVDFTRDGIPMQAVLPRGPLGIESRNWRRGT